MKHATIIDAALLSERAALEEALNFDALAEAERITGMDSQTNAHVTFLGMALMQEHSKKKARLLAKNDDTNSWSQTFKEWEAVVLRMGFSLLSCEPIENGEGNFYRIYWKPGLLLSADSYWGDKSVNSSMCYFNYKGPRQAMHSCSSEFVDEVDGVPVWAGSRDAREGLRFALDDMESQGEVLKQWVRPGFVWLKHYGEKDRPYQEANQARIAAFPEEVRKAICAQ